MRRTLTGIGLWVGAAIIAVVVAFQGVNVVGDQVTDERPAALAASDIEDRLADASTSTTGTPTSSASLPTTTTAAPDSVPSTDVAPPPPTSGPTPTSPETVVPAPTSTSPAAETRTYELVGGTAVLRFSPSGVEVVFATPNPGFSVEEEPEHGNGVKVEFESESHESRVDGWWDGGPQERVREEPGN